uniref:Uncharacterized protein LOC111138407 isoform X1 n=1 Tax=Crassostrea virginica TaxID=6565 RepID=A0A8B8F1F0_CRAVI|nr:uncharacterized protein LOC111138407 isoform X1 [Crassostrea virginica]
MPCGNDPSPRPENSPHHRNENGRDVKIKYGLRCYVCEETTSQQTCRSGEHLLQDRFGGGPFIRNCSRQFEFCVTEAIINAGGVYVSFMRSCTDGDYVGKKVARLSNVTPNNETECAYDQLSGLKFCVALCKSDFCNGPQLSSSSNGAGADALPLLSAVLAMTVYTMLNWW